MTYLDYLEQKVLLERLVIGLEEPVLIKGLGELSAKIDSGNGGYNVIHGTDFHQQGDKLMFTTHDCNGNEKKIQAKVIDSIEINMGGGNIESRPVIELDIKFAGEDYKKIPFSVSDRSTNTNPILISKGFVVFLCVCLYCIYTYIQLSVYCITLTIIKSDYIGEIIMLKIFLIYVQYIII